MSALDELVSSTAALADAIAELGKVAIALRDENEKLHAVREAAERVIDPKCPWTIRALIALRRAVEESR